MHNESLITAAVAGFLIAVTGCTRNGSDERYYTEVIQTLRSEKDLEFRDPETTPFKDLEDAAQFSQLEYFPVYPSYKVMAEIIKTPEEPWFEIPTSSGITKTYRRYGLLRFGLGDRQVQLVVLQGKKMLETEAYRDQLFLPFRDATCGQESYGGGRYIDLKIPKGDSVELDFNLAYNPYCAYSDGYNCPIPPTDNWLDFRIEAGEMKYDH